MTYGSQSDGAALRGMDGLWAYRFPGFQLTASEHVFKGERIEPVAPGRLRSVNWLWSQGIDPTKVSDACEWSKQVVHEDLGACEKVQTNLQAGVYKDGPLSPLQETHVAKFQSLVREAIGYPATEKFPSKKVLTCMLHQGGRLFDEKYWKSMV